MELQQQQQQIISMEMVDNVTFRTLLTKLINVVLAIVAVVLVVVSTAANLVAPFLTTRYYMSRFIEMFDSLHDKFFLCSHSEPNIYIYTCILCMFVIRYMYFQMNGISVGYKKKYYNTWINSSEFVVKVSYIAHKRQVMILLFMILC